jgi:hypothetical protein
MWFWICLAAVIVLTAIALGFAIRRAVISATTFEELERAMMRNRQAHRRSHYGQYLYRKDDKPKGS